jgi:hypothetical protein
MKKKSSFSGEKLPGDVKMQSCTGFGISVDLGRRKGHGSVMILTNSGSRSHNTRWKAESRMCKGKSTCC